MGCGNHLCPFMRKRPTAYRIRNGQRTDGIYAQPTLHRTNTYMHLGQSTTFATKKVRNSISNKTNGLRNWNLLRTSILAFSIIVNLITYYGLANSTSALFCLLITLAGFVFSLAKTL